MVIRRQDPWTLLNQLGGELNRLYEGQLDPDTSSPATSDWAAASSSWVPPRATKCASPRA